MVVTVFAHLGKCTHFFHKLEWKEDENKRFIFQFTCALEVFGHYLEFQVGLADGMY